MRGHWNSDQGDEQHTNKRKADYEKIIGDPLRGIRFGGLQSEPGRRKRSIQQQQRQQPDELDDHARDAARAHHSNHSQHDSGRQPERHFQRLFRCGLQQWRKQHGFRIEWKQLGYRRGNLRNDD
jgi:hypothetical protein